jgi:hypothetical protein
MTLDQRKSDFETLPVSSAAFAHQSVSDCEAALLERGKAAETSQEFARASKQKR